AQGDRPIGEAVVVDDALGGEPTAREKSELGAGSPRGVLEERADVTIDGADTPAREQIAKTALAGHVRRDLGPQVAGRLALAADLRQDQPKDVVDDRAVGHETDDRNDD